MRKKVRKLVLGRETLWRLEGVAGGVTVAIGCTGSDNCGPPDDGGRSYGTCFRTCGVCSAACETGGACTVTC
jgi:hypothetical protein